MPSRLVPVLAFTALLVLAALAGCGGSSGNGVASKSAAQILAASRTAAARASAVRIAGESAQGRLKLALNLQLSHEAGHSRLELLGTKFEVIRTGNTIYLKGTPRFYRRLDLDPTRIPQGAWVKVSDAAVRSSQFASLATLGRETRQLLETTGSVTKGAATNAGGQPVIELKTKGRLYSGAIYVATTGQPYPLKLERHGEETSHLTFTNWNQPISVTAPTTSVDIGQVGSNRDS